MRYPVLSTPEWLGGARSPEVSAPDAFGVVGSMLNMLGVGVLNEGVAGVADASGVAAPGASDAGIA